MSRVVRSSKYRHVFGQVAKKEECYDELKITRSAWDSNYVCASPKFFAVILESGGGGAFEVLPYSASGKVNPQTPLVAGHKGPVLDIDFNPFNDNLITSVSEDCTGKVWLIPDGGLTSTLTEPVQNLLGHRRKVGTVLFNPVANNIVATTSADLSVKIWDIEKGKDVCSIDAQHSDLINSFDWNANGSLAATTSKDKKVRIVDPRLNKVVTEGEGHQGVKGSRVCWLTGDKVFTTGFTKTTEREYAVWDARDATKPLIRTTVDSSSGLLLPFFDRDTSVLFLAGKGDGNIRYFEIVDEAPYIFPLSEFKSNVPQRGMCMLPKRAVNVSECEIVRMFKLSVNKMEPISFQVPRKSDIFQPDLFPNCFAGEPALTADQWLAGENAEPKTASLEGGFIKKESSASFAPVVQQEEKSLSEKELKEDYEKLKKRVAYLEAELVKRDARIKELEGN